MSATVDGVAPDGDSPQPAGDEVEPEPDDGRLDFADFADFDDLETRGDDDTGEQESRPDDPDNGTRTALPGKVEAWRKRSASGAVLTGIALGLGQVFGKEREDPAIIMTTSGDPPRDLPVEAEVEYGRPRRSVVSVRPWLLDTRGSAPAPGDAESAGDAAGRADAGPSDSPASGTQPGGTQPGGT